MTECGEDILGLELWAAAAHWAVVWLDLADGWGPTGINPRQNNTDQSFSHYSVRNWVSVSILSEMQVTNNSTKYVKISKKEKKSARQTTKQNFVRQNVIVHAVLLVNGGPFLDLTL